MTKINMRPHVDKVLQPGIVDQYVLKIAGIGVAALTKQGAEDLLASLLVALGKGALLGFTFAEVDVLAEAAGYRLDGRITDIPESRREALTACHRKLVEELTWRRATQPAIDEEGAWVCSSCQRVINSTKSSDTDRCEDCNAEAQIERERGQ